MTTDKLPESLKPSRYAALDILRDYNYYTPPINLIQICEWEGIIVMEFDFIDKLSVFSSYFDFKSKILYLNKSDDELNKVFMIAFFLWIFTLNRDLLEKEPEKYSIFHKKIWNFEESKDKVIRESLCFARNLLVPKFMLDVYYSVLDINDLSKVFWVSPILIQKRISQEYE